MQLKVNWLVLVFTVVVFGGGCGILATIIMGQAIRDFKRGVPFSNGAQWPSLLGLVLACLVGITWVLWIHYCFVKTTITDEYISQARLRGPLTIAWSQVEKITPSDRRLTIQGPQGKIELVPEAYLNCHEVVEKVAEIVERHSIPFA